MIVVKYYWNIIDRGYLWVGYFDSFAMIEIQLHSAKARFIFSLSTVRNTRRGTLLKKTKDGQIRSRIMCPG